MNWRGISTLILGLLFIVSEAARSETKSTGVLPKGRFTMLYKYMDSRFTDQFNDEGIVKSFTDAANLTLDGQILATVDPQIKSLLENMERLKPGSTKGFNLGEIQAEAEINVHVDVFVLGYGLTDNITLFGAIPYWKAEVIPKRMVVNESNSNLLMAKAMNDLKVKIDAQMTDEKAKQERLRKDKPTNWEALYRKSVEISDEFGALSLEASAMAQVSEQSIPQVTGNDISRVLSQDYYNYQLAGGWDRKGFGDIETGIKWRYLDTPGVSSLVEFGVRAPTGDQKNAEILQNFGFGDGSWDNWVSVSTDFKPLDWLRINQTITAEVQYPAKGSMRLPETNSTDLTTRQGLVEWNPGDSFKTDTSIVTPLFWRWELGLSYMAKWKGIDRFKHSNPATVRYLESNTQTHQQTAGLEILYTSVNDFVSGEAGFPMMAWVNYDWTLDGKNVPDNDIMGVNVQLFF